MNKFCSKKIYSPVLSRCRDNQKARTFLVIKGLQSLSIIKQALAESSYCFPNHECIPSSKHFAAHFEPQMANSTQTKVARPLFYIAHHRLISLKLLMIHGIHHTGDITILTSVILGGQFSKKTGFGTELTIFLQFLARISFFARLTTSVSSIYLLLFRITSHTK